ncbi:GLPGLI family protein [Formosa haliotis]|uniref:GLPGLI family protein n=1 Tax=Formosa haliotis TaxID=1555194 RepID=UPI0008253FB6|nr:GLPGLI family protein [Formosa haliotis]
MKLNYLLLILCFSVNYHFGIAQNGYAYYKKQLANDTKSVSDPQIKKAFRLLEEQEYQLAFNGNGALFKKEKTLTTEQNPIITAYAEGFAQYSGQVYFNSKNKTITQQKEISGTTFLVQQQPIEWKLSKDTLKIDRYTCYKATATKTLETVEGPQKTQITAWYSPELPLSYGPDGYGQLPGLILQLEHNGVISTLKRLKFEANNPVTIDPPTKGKSISETDFNEMIKNAFNSRKNR